MSALRSMLVRKSLIAPLAVMLLVAACSRVSAENYGKVHAGMTRDQVYEILGQPDEVSGGGFGPLTISAEIWKGSKQTIHVTFGGEKVALKSISTNTPGE